MNMSKLELVVAAGPLSGRRFAVPEAGLRLGRSSSCEISIADPSLSRNHCLFEMREGALWVTDLASINGTLVNGKNLGSESARLAAGDVVTVGDSEVQVVASGDAEAQVVTVGDAEAQAVEATANDAPAVDLGLGRDEAAEDEAVEEGAAPRPNVLRLVLWGVAGLAVLAAAYMIAGVPPQGGDEPAAKPIVEVEPPNSGKLVAIAFEKVQASSEGIYRFALDYGADGTLSAVVDDVPKANRHVEKSVRLAPAKMERLEQLFKDAALYALESTYVQPALRAGEQRTTRLKVVRTVHVFETCVANMQEPETLRDVREQLEAFAKNELGIWGIDKSVDELKAMSAEARRTGDAKWTERDVQHGNLAQAIAAYDEAVMLLGTVTPKPDGYDALIARIREAKEELDRRYRDQCFRADRAINLKDWTTALAELRVLCDLVPDERDPRHAEANAKLLDVEARQKGGKK